MANFSNMMLIEGLEEILTNPKFDTGVDIVSTLHDLIAKGLVENDGKVKTLISERTFEGHHGDDDDDGEAVVATVATTSVQAAAAPVAPPLSSFPIIIELAKALDAKMQASPTLVEPELIALMEAIKQKVNIAEKLSATPSASEDGEISYPTAIATVADILAAKLQEDEAKTLQLLEQLYPVITSGKLPQADSAPQFSDNTLTLMQRIEKLPERYMDILLQLLSNWEKQVK